MTQTSRGFWPVGAQQQRNQTNHAGNIIMAATSCRGSY
jgi:hypothetical protein